MGNFSLFEKCAGREKHATFVFLFFQKLSAMDLLNLLDEKISKFVSALMQHFCQRIITSEDPAGVTIYPGAITFAKHEYVVHKEKPPEKGNRRRPDPEIVFR